MTSASGAAAPATPRTGGRTGGLTWSLRDRTPEQIEVRADGLPGPSADPWRWSDGSGVGVCIVDSGIEAGHPDIGAVRGAWSVVTGEDGPEVVPVEPADACGHGTACAGIVRRVAPACDLYSVRVLGPGSTGTGAALLAGLRWAVDQGFSVVNLSLSTTRPQFVDELRAIADNAYFRGVLLVASAHNTPVESFPWRFSSVISVGSHRESRPDLHLYNPRPPVEFFAPGQNVEVPWPGGRRIRTTGNSFATPFVSGLCARLLGSHPRLTPFQVKNALYLAAGNTRTGTSSETTGPTAAEVTHHVPDPDPDPALPGRRGGGA
ncbi:S8 family serine peptidase [Streptomyces sp. YIM 98790]|uniref:S8 family peptidase n=1 Tax=Streptomyces sp. YIM 98790 TaxID=2689077 RepID=UPI00140B5E9C|nr:S8 family serine peptidase [Streptomyces sp. YIM 98790]